MPQPNLLSRKQKRKAERKGKKQQQHIKRQCKGAIESNISKEELKTHCSAISKDRSRRSSKKPASTSHTVFDPLPLKSLEDAEIEMLEKKLGIASNSKSSRSNFKKLQKEYARDGLDEDFADFLKNLDSITKSVRGGNSKSLSEEQYEDPEMKLLVEEDAEFLNGMQDLPTDEEESESESEPECDSEVARNTQMNRECTLSIVKSTENKKKPVKKDIYGQNAQSDDGKAYIPPFARANADKSADKCPRELVRAINGQLNRISEANLESICIEFERLYRQFPRVKLNELLLDRMLHLCSDSDQVMLPLIKICAALITALFHGISAEVGGFFLENFTVQLHKFRSNTQENVSSTKTITLLLFIAMLYNFQICSSALIFDLFRSFLDSFKSIDIELMYELLKNCSKQLHSDDHESLKQMIHLVQENAAFHIASSTFAGSIDQDQRIRVILDLIYDLKKPSHAKAKQSNPNSELKSLRKCIGRIKSRTNSTNPPFSVTLDQLLHADKNGRWWIIGGTFAGHVAIKPLESRSSALYALAEKHRMNTDVRKQIFVAIMGATDATDAYERLIQLHLKPKQEREIVRVILHCCAQEKNFNPFYAALGIHLCAQNQNFSFSFQLAFYDQFKRMENEFRKRCIENLSSLFTHFLIAPVEDTKDVKIGCISLACLKVLDFTNLRPAHVQFIQLVLYQLICTDKDSKREKREMVTLVLQRVLLSKSAAVVIDGLFIFTHQFIDDAFFEFESNGIAREELKETFALVRSLLLKLKRAI